MPRFLNKTGKAVLLKRQDNCCAYCDQEFDVLNVPVFDHFVPFVWSQRTLADEMFAACVPCNSKKNDRHFESLEHARRALNPNVPAKPVWVRRKESSAKIRINPNALSDKKCNECGKFIPLRIKNPNFCSPRCRRRNYLKSRFSWWK